MEGKVVLNQVVVLFLVMLVGFITKKKGIITAEVNKKLSELLLYVTSPLLIISSFSFRFSKDILQNVGIVFAFSVAMHIFSILLGKFLFIKFPENIKKILQYTTIYSNCGYMGFPVLESMFGKIGVFYGSIYVMVFNMFMWTNGVMIFTGQKDWKTMKKALINPGIIAVAVGMVLFLFSVTLPAPVSQAVEMIGSMTSPLSMLIIGAILADMDFRSMFSGWALYYGSIIRLLVLPVLTFAGLRLVGFSKELFGICLILAAMPAAANTAILAEMFDADSAFASRSVAFTTLLSIITIPLMSMLAHSF